MLFTRIDGGMYPNLQFLLLTKRPSNINKMIPGNWISNPPKNVIFGASISDQETAYIIVPQLLKVNGRKFLSIEPQIGKVSLSDLIWKECQGEEGRVAGIDWVIVGGESGGGKREFNPDWARSLREECQTAQIPFFMKQWDKIKAVPEDLLIRQFPKL
jgi:protein gp37